MALTTAQKATLKTNILSITGPGSPAEMYTDGNLSGLADYYNVTASPDFWVWRTNVSRAEIYNTASPTGSFWDWTTYKNQGASEQNAWTQMFMGDAADFSRQNLRDGIGKIFGAANAQTTHCLAMGRRLATRLEKVLATGTGSAASPAVMGAEGALRFDDLINL